MIYEDHYYVCLNKRVILLINDRYYIIRTLLRYIMATRIQALRNGGQLWPKGIHSGQLA